MISALAGKTSVTALLAISAALAATAQAQLSERPCRIVYDDQSWGRVDHFKTHGEINLGPRMPQAGGGFMLMGQGTQEVEFDADLRDGCTITEGATKTFGVQAFVMSEDGRTGEVDIVASGDMSHRVTFKCAGVRQGPLPNSVDYGLITPPTVTIQMIHGATAPYEDADPGNRTGNRGVMKIEYCRADPQQRPAR
jgi:hypothetical protein